MLRKIVCGALLLGISAVGVGQGNAVEVAQDVAKKIAKVSGYTATITSGEITEEGPGPSISSEMMVSRLYGWKMIHKGANGFTMVTDFNTFYNYVPSDNQVLKTTGDTPEMKAMLTKPVSDMNPLALLDHKSLQLLGEEKFQGETVYHVEGTTESQLMPGGPRVKRVLSTWISKEDGLPRKTLESVGFSTGTTVYSNVKINPDLSPETFTFTPPEGARLIDTNDEIRKMNQQIKETGEASRTSGSLLK